MLHVNLIARLDSFRKYILYPKYYIIVKPYFSLPFSLKDKLKKFTVEKETLESQLKNEKDEKELYKVSILLLHDQNVDGVDLQRFSCIFLKTLLQKAAPVIDTHRLSEQAIASLFSSGFSNLSVTLWWLAVQRNWW